MIEILHEYKKDWSMFTLASLLDKSRDFRLHLYVHEDDWADAPIDWVIANFDEVKIYQSWWRTENSAKMLCHYKNWWKDKIPGSNKRILVANGNKIFLREIVQGNIPEESFFMKSLSFISHKHRFKDHPNYKTFYGRIGVPTIENAANQLDPEMLVLNWDVLKNFKDEDLFMPANDLPRDFYNLDARIDACTNLALMKNLMLFKHSKMPLYMNGTTDDLIEKDCLGLKEVADYNNMLRKGYMLSVQHKWAMRDYTLTPISVQLGMPWDCYTRLIDKIPMQWRNARLNERLLQKANKQKATLGKLLQTGFKLGKL